MSANSWQLRDKQPDGDFAQKRQNPLVEPVLRNGRNWTRTSDPGRCQRRNGALGIGSTSIGKWAPGLGFGDSAERSPGDKKTEISITSQFTKINKHTFLRLNTVAWNYKWVGMRKLYIYYSVIYQTPQYRWLARL